MLKHTARSAIGTLVCLLALLIFAEAVFGQSSDRNLSPQVRSEIEATVSKFMATTHVPGVSIAVVEKGKLVWATGFGLADAENNVPATEHTLFRLGSISKSVTAAAAMELVERGKLDLDAPVERYCPAFPEKSAPITTRLVMGHLIRYSTLQVLFPE